MKTKYINIERKQSCRSKHHLYQRLDRNERITLFNVKLFESFIESLTQEDFITYPDIHELQHKIAKYNNVSVEQIFITSGSEQVIKCLFEIVKTGEFITTKPSFPMYEVYSKLFNMCSKYVNYDNNLYLSTYKILEQITHNTTLIILANPNSPIGDYKYLADLTLLAKRTNKLGIPLLIDEAYVEFSPKSVKDLILNFNNVGISRTFSKAFGAAGIRLGYCIGQPEFINHLNKFRHMYATNNLAIKFAMFLFDNISLVQRYIKQTIEVRNMLQRIVCKSHDMIPSHGNWLHFNDLYNNKKAIDIFNTYNVAYKTCTIPHDNRLNWIRLTIGPDILKYKPIQEIFDLSSEK